MELRIRPMRYEERKYTYAQSSQLEGQTACIGHLRGDFGSGGMKFWTTWEDHRQQWKTDEFKTELDEVINALRSDEYGLLKDRRSMVSFVRAEPDSAFKGNYTTEYGFRVDTDNHAFLIRCNPQQGDYNFYCYCYVSKWLDQHIEKAAEDIRFIDSGYKELFRLPMASRSRLPWQTVQKLIMPAVILTKLIWRLGAICTISVSLPSEWKGAALPMRRRSLSCQKGASVSCPPVQKW